MGGALARRWQELQVCRRLVMIDPASQALKSAQDIPPNFKPEIIVFAVKPQALGEIIDGYKSIAAKALVISIAAGKTISFFESHLGDKTRVIRSMPNTPASIGKGITVACANANAAATDKEWAGFLLGAVGEVLWVEKESLLDPVTAVSGSGPAYLFLLIETLAKAGVRAGLDPAMAEKLARQTIIGSAALAEIDAATPAAQLRANVTSPGGTTEAALNVLTANPGVQDLFDRAIAAAVTRAGELAGA